MKTIRSANISLWLCIATFVIPTTVAADHHKTPVDLAGVWQVEASTDNGELKLSWTFTKTDDGLRGTSLNPEEGNERTFDKVEVKEKTVTLEMEIESEGRSGVIRVEVKEETPGNLIGKWNVTEEDGTEYASGSLTARKKVLFAGQWGATAEMTDGSTNKSTLTLTGKNSALKGRIDGELGTVDLDKVVVNDLGIRMEFEFNAGESPVDVVIKAKTNGSESLAGNWIAYGDDGSVAAQGKWSAKRQIDFAGKWDVVAGVPNNADYHGTLTLARKKDGYSGISRSENGDASALASIKVSDKSVVFTVPFESQGNTGTIIVKAKVQEDGSLDGEWALTDSDGNEYAREIWKATKN